MKPSLRRIVKEAGARICEEGGADDILILARRVRGKTITTLAWHAGNPYSLDQMVTNLRDHLIESFREEDEPDDAEVDVEADEEDDD